MLDYGARYTDKEINRVERELHGVYQQAKEELEDKLDEFYQKHKARDRMKRTQLADGKITRQEYQDWMNGQIFQREQWKRQIKQINHVLYDINSQAVKIVNERRLDVFAENYNYFAYLGEQNPGISFELYDARSVARLIREHPQILPEWKIDEEKDYTWNAKKVNNIVTQGIIQGEGIGEIAQRLSRDLSSQNENKMLMFARTAMTGAQNAGRQQCMEDTANMGVDTHKKWVATLDKRTRDSHRHLDGQEVPYNEDFESDHGAIRYPGDPEADPAEVFNCRCTMVTIFPKYEDRTKRDWREDEIIDGQTYAEWKNGKQMQKNNSPFIMAQEDGRVISDIRGASENGSGNWTKLTEVIEYGELFDEASVKITKDTLDKLYDEYPVEQMAIVGDIRVIRNLDRDADRFELEEQYHFGAHYLQKGNAVIPNGRSGIEVLSENFSTYDLKTEFRERSVLREKYGCKTVSTAFTTASDTLEGTIVHEYAHAIQDEYGLIGGNRSEQAMKFSKWLYQYWEDKKEDVRQISNYAADHPFEMMAEAFVQLHDTEHMGTEAYRLSREIWDEFDDYRLRRGHYGQ